MNVATRAPNRWQMLKNEWAHAMAQNQQVTVRIRVLYPPDGSQPPAALEVYYTIDGESFTRTFRGIPDGYDAAQQP